MNLIKMDLDILYEDDLIAIINKPVGLVVHPGNGNFSNTLVNGLVHHFKFLSDRLITFEFLKIMLSSFL